MSDILKEAIADAKAVRETALQNAKMALEEAFTPQLKNMLSAKLKEDEYEDEEEEYHSEVDKGLIAFLGTLTEWIIAAGIVFIVLAFVSNLEY